MGYAIVADAHFKFEMFDNIDVISVERELTKIAEEYKKINFYFKKNEFNEANFCIITWIGFF